MIYISPRDISESKITVTNTATKLLDLVEAASGVPSSGQYYLTQKLANIIMLTVESVGIRWLDGTDPTATQGNLLAVGANFMIPGVHLENLRLISIGGDASVGVQFVRSTDEVAVLGQSYSNASGGSSSSTTYTVRTDDATSTLTYVGKSLPGSLTSDSAWQIAQLDTSVSNQLIETYANGNANFSNVWDNRASLTYS